MGTICPKKNHDDCYRFEAREVPPRGCSYYCDRCGTQVGVNRGHVCDPWAWMHR